MDEKIKEIEERHEANKRISGTYNTSIYGSAIEYLLSRIKELHDAIHNAQEDNLSEVHCSCVPRLKVRIKELEEGIEKYLVGWDKEGPNWNTDILEKLVEKK